MDHGPVPFAAQLAHKRVDVVGIEDPRQPPHPADQRQPLARTTSCLTSGDAPGDGVGVDADVVSGDQVAIEARDRGQAPLDGGSRQPGLAIGDAQHVLGAGAGPTLFGDEVEHVLRPHLGGVLPHHGEEHVEVHSLPTLSGVPVLPSETHSRVPL